MQMNLDNARMYIIAVMDIPFNLLVVFVLGVIGDRVGSLQLGNWTGSWEICNGFHNLSRLLLTSLTGIPYHSPVLISLGVKEEKVCPAYICPLLQLGGPNIRQEELWLKAFQFPKL